MSEPSGQELKDVRPAVKVLEWIGDAQRGTLRLLDQTALPAVERYVDCRDTQAVWDAIRGMVVRGAPAIGVAAGYGMVVAGEWIPDGADFLVGLEAAAEHLAGSRPTAVNLQWGVRRVLARAADQWRLRRDPRKCSRRPARSTPRTRPCAWPSGGMPWRWWASAPAC